MDEFMKEALGEAKQSLAEGGIPIGSVLVREGKIIGRGHNRRVQDNDEIMHAEINCLRNAGRQGSFKGEVLYTTLTPCYLCAGAAVQFGIKKVIAGESQNFSGTREFLEQHGVEVVDLDLPEAKQLLGEFIQKNPKLWQEDIGKL